jgi:hydrogenase maturation factor
MLPSQRIERWFNALCRTQIAHQLPHRLGVQADMLHARLASALDLRLLRPVHARLKLFEPSVDDAITTGHTQDLPTETEYTTLDCAKSLLATGSPPTQHRRLQHGKKVLVTGQQTKAPTGILAAKRDHVIQLQQ